MSETSVPDVGQGATAHSHDDCYPYVVLAVSADGSEVTMAALQDADETGEHQPARHERGVPVWDHRYTDEELVAMRVPCTPVHVYRHADGGYRSSGGAKVTFGVARYRRGSEGDAYCPSAEHRRNPDVVES